jgi:serine protease Do
VRITQMNGIDLNRFEFDCDTTWGAFFLDADLNVYSRYGGRDGESSDGRLTVDSFVHTMHEVLEVHARSARNPAKDTANHHPAPVKPATAEQIPLLAANHQGCVHCHQVGEYRLLQAAHDKSFQRSQLFGYPLPENLGLSLDRSHGHRVKAVRDDSPAAHAEIRPGDEIVRVNDVLIHSEQDIRWALHRAANAAPITVQVARVGRNEDEPPRPLNLKIVPPDGWRQTDLSWRKSLRSVPFPMGFLGYALGNEERDKANLAASTLAIRVVSLRGEGLGRNLGLLKGDLIIALEDQAKSRSFEQFKSDLLGRYQPGEMVRVTVRREGQTRELRGRFPDWHTDETSVP